MEGNDSLWETGKTSSENKEETEEETDTLDLSEPSPEKERPDEEINLNQKVEEKDTTEDDNWAIPLAEDKEGIDIKTVGAIGTVVILILT